MVEQGEGTTATPVQKASSKKFPRGLMWIGIAILLMGIALPVGILTLVTGLVQPIVTVGESFMTALKTDDFARAYELCAPDLQRTIGTSTGIASRVRDRKPETWSWSQRRIRNGVGIMEGSYTTADGKTGSIRIDLDDFDGQWKIVGFTLN
jgi:hypothetical protein